MPATRRAATGRYDTLLGELAGTPFYIDEDLYWRWGHPALLIDISAGAAGGFSLEGPENLHFLTRSEPS